MTALYLQAAAVLAISILAFALVTKAAWPSNVYLYGRLRGWLRSRPEAWKRFRDPAYRRRQESVDHYLSIFGSLLVLRAQRDKIARDRREAGDAAARFLDALAEDVDARYQGMQVVAQEYMRGLGAEVVGDIADRLNADLFQGRRPAEDLRAFLEEERALISGSPEFAADHAKRLTARFAARPEAT
ncbi:MAG TPA: hypothetical protein VL426_07135 [Candidatus Binatia bacterium]|jgi:hypothetical protein|nr:hypothetical protein [Candidatus Binatia bacterium]